MLWDLAGLGSSLASPPTRCAAGGKLAGPQLPHLYNGHGNLPSPEDPEDGIKC